jgi:hypothetical protein
MAGSSVPWGSPGITEQLEIQETPIAMPTATGGPVARPLQRAGFLRKLRFWSQAHLNVTAYTSAPTRSVWGPLGAYINNINVKANGQIDLVNLSGLSATVYDEVQNRDGSILSTPASLAAHNMLASTSLLKYDAVGATGDFYAYYPFEFQHAIPFSLSGQMTELGMWLLQNQAIDLAVNINFNAPYVQGGAAGNNVLWGGGTLTATTVLADDKVLVERELYSIPNDPGSYPNLAWAHQVIEFQNPWTGSQSIFAIQRAGLMLRVVVICLDSSGIPFDISSEVTSFKWVYGSNETPIDRPGWAYCHEFVHDYNRLPQAGVMVLDFYKWGFDGLKLVKSTEDLANLRIQATFASKTTGTMLVILDRLIPVATS